MDEYIDRYEPRCRECEYCKMISRANSTYRTPFGRGHFYCVHPKTKETRYIEGRPIGFYTPRFIGYGTPERDTVLQVKTRPRWCPTKGDTDECIYCDSKVDEEVEE